MNVKIVDKISEISRKIDFSGSVLVKEKDSTLAEVSYGYANRSDQLQNNSSTRFGIASGSKLFTAISICQLVDKGLLSFDTKLQDCLEDEFPFFYDNITIHHLLTHTSGIPDYFDEEIMDDFEELWVQNPMYHLRELKNFLPLFQTMPMKHNVGEVFHYNNAGYIILGLIVEQVSKLDFSEYVQEYILKPANMTKTGFFTFDALPSSTALGYIDKSDGSWKSNIYSLPVKGASDGGIYVTTSEMANLWRALLTYELLDKDLTDTLLQSHVQVDGNRFYGYGVWIRKSGDDVLKYYIMGYDPGVSFHAVYYPQTSMIIVVCSNKSDGAFDILSGIEEEII